MVLINRHEVCGGSVCYAIWLLSQGEQQKIDPRNMNLHVMVKPGTVVEWRFSGNREAKELFSELRVYNKQAFHFGEEP